MFRWKIMGNKKIQTHKLSFQQVLEFLSAKHVFHAQKLLTKSFLNYKLFWAWKPVVREMQAVNSNLDLL